MYISKVKVKELMTKKGISTQTQLAQMLGMTKNQLSVMLSERFNPIKSNVLGMCKVLETNPLDIIEDSDMVHGFSVNGMFNFPDLNNRNIKVVELFAGTGGLALGLEKAGLDTVELVEIDRFCCETLKRNRPGWNIINKDVREVDFTKYRGRVEVVTGGFPCQAFSYAGKKLGFEDTRGTLFYEFARCVNEIKPVLFLAENVRGLISHDNGRTLAAIISIFKDLGYNIQYKLLNAVNYGVPQKRERVVIVGTKEGINFKYPEKEKKIITLREALKGVPKSDGQQYSNSKRKVLELVPPGGCWRNLPDAIQKEYMGKSFYSGGGRTGMARRISWEEPCLTLTCSPSQKQTERCHPDETRPFTVREYARIQTFPDDWEFVGGIGEKYKQIGNAVPVEFAYKLGLQIVEAVNEYRVKGISNDEAAAAFERVQ